MPESKSKVLKKSRWWTALTALAAVVLGLSSLLFFLTPEEIKASLRDLDRTVFLLSLAVFLAGCVVTVFRWHACVGFRCNWWAAFHTMGVAHGANLLIPGRAGEPLRVFLLARLGVPAEFGVSGLVQERLADQILRVLFFGGALTLYQAEGEDTLLGRLLGLVLLTLVVTVLLIALVRGKKRVSRSMGSWLGRLPRVKSESVEKFVLETLTDLAGCMTRGEGRLALFWGFVAWVVLLWHTQLVLTSYFDSGTWAMACLILAFAPATSPTQPGIFHGVALGAMMLLGATRVPALQASIILHGIQMVIFGVWGVAGWLYLERFSRALGGED